MKMSYVLAAAALFTLTACADNENTQETEETVDVNSDTEMETLRETTEELSERLEQEQERSSELEDQVGELYEENMELKDNLLTYRQEIVDLDSAYEEERDQQQLLENMALELFQAMHERDEDTLQGLMGEEVEVDAEGELFTFTEDDISRSFHFMRLGNVHFAHQRSFTLEGEEAVSEYEFYEAQDEELSLEGVVEVRFSQDEEEEWQVVSLQFMN